MNPSDIWGATEATHGGLPEPEVTLDENLDEVIDCTHMSPEEAFKAGLKAGKKRIVKEFDDYFTDPKKGAHFSTPKILETLGCTSQELDALCVDNLDFFDIDRLPQMYQTFRRNTDTTGTYRS
ncbi:hypothetical protein S21ZY_148 [Pseudomonas phage ZY21]|nr:hypothetical protein S21ZY_148 [Pseudomonas phage ZY21]